MYTAISPSPFRKTKLGKRPAPYARAAAPKKRSAKATTAVATPSPIVRAPPPPTPLVPATPVPTLPTTSWKRLPLSTASKRQVIAIGAISTVRADLRKKFTADAASFQ
ncbi:hypothetical protein SPRG_10706 [Saprolegnia parasitica CBS 223.65]|uniref:Uncharacterized protein n=1 Tax=Saprolegnia parasitica (strain CBS 223.65) TaxID=695850 RepID=A0A067C4E1_SAPPC|nr:hypothetical protein SPRG_10706 [Saprolegnia parasitica CBS 223.65]KDO24010.1 hypothetical protein SPRG_10706 [Saprolegnia parasitica CBS 223.65]|eukprot:XP_012205329.1 hypothetical protein SPRG_10706 [Saprolegnia parasitica CBS 223.65]